VIAAKLRQLASYAARGRGSVRGMDETPSAMAERPGLRGAEAAAVLRFGLGEDDGNPHREADDEYPHPNPSLSAADSAASERRSVRTMTLGGVTLAVLAAAVIGFPQSGPDPTYVGAGRGSVVGPGVKAAGGSVGHPRDATHKEQAQMSTLRNSIQASVVAGATLIAASANAQAPAVQWKVNDGGNGHWYQLHTSARQQTWFEARDIAVSKGGYLATATSASEAILLGGLSMMPEAWSNGGYVGPWLGGYQDHGAVDYAEPSAGWRWVTNEPWSFTAWDPIGNQPSNGPLPGEDFLHLSSYSWTWNDLRCCDGGVIASIIEWSADCNKDGIVDYGQCHEGTLPDYNGNNIPDCCDQGQACVPGHYPVQWRVEDGGNGHWYEVHPLGGPTSWAEARAEAKALGGDLASLESPTEPNFVYEISGNATGWGSRVGPWLGGFQDTSASDFVEPGGGWRWTSGAPWSFTDWGQAEPNNSPAPENYLHLISNNCPGYPDGRFFNDVRGDFAGVGPCDKMPISAIIEWSADCNNDNIVDYGQILLGQLADTNTNGTPDICEGPTCRDADLFRDGTVNGADLGILLAQWGVANANTVSDINHDGRVDGSDLGTLLAFWGPCPN
jgi:hypothetical protein